jgi:nucleolar protein 12
MDPYEAAPLAAEKCDGTVFMERMIRVDTVGKAVQAGEKTQDKDGAISGDPKLCVFVGNLDFGSKEEDLRVFFEGVVSGERGPPSEEAAREDAALKKQVSWVTRVRIVRDKETQLGKGFAYVQFLVGRLLGTLWNFLIKVVFVQDRQCVDEVLAIEETKLKFAKRKLRVQRCKTLPVGSSLSGLRRSATDAPSLLRHKTASGVTPVVPKGDPSLGEKLAHLPKSARKEYKSSDAKRVARRLAKKKARMALAKNGLKARAGDRDRVRKGVKKDLGPGVRKEVKAKGRVRSDKSLAKRNNKK